MMMTTKYQATAPDGTVFRRSTMNRRYTHCVVRQYADAEGWGDASAEWRRTHELAEALARTYRGHGRKVLVLEAVEV
jgi:hypothetical protein